MVQPRKRLSLGLQNPKSNYNAVQKLSLQKGFQLNTGISALFSYCNRTEKALGEKQMIYDYRYKDRVSWEPKQQGTLILHKDMGKD